MKTCILFTKDIYLSKTFSKNHTNLRIKTVETMEDLQSYLKKEVIVLYDYSGDMQTLKKVASQAQVVVLSHVPSFSEGVNLLNLPIHGYANRYISKKHLQQALKTIENGDIWLYPEFIHEMIQKNTHNPVPNIHAFSSLTKREQEIATSVREGLSNDEIRKSLNITYKTVKSHIKSIFTKVGVHDRLSLSLQLA